MPMFAHLSSFHRQASRHAAKKRDHRKQMKYVDDFDDSPEEKVLPDNIVESEIKGDFEVELLQSNG